jgi:hypothetical protein
LRACAVIVSSLAMAVLGCGRTIDSGKLEGRISKEISGAVEVKCPDGVKLKKGDEFTCSALVATTPGLQGPPTPGSPPPPALTPVTVKVRQVNDDGNVRFSYRTPASAPAVPGGPGPGAPGSPPIGPGAPGAPGQPPVPR